ncbi:MAG: PAS domain S-box protein [Gemmatimonadaceae bacterium]
MDRCAGDLSAGALERVIRDPARVERVRATALLDTPAEADFDRLTRLASRILGVPMALVSFVDGDRDFWKSCLGLPEPFASAREIRIGPSFCQYAVVSGAPLVVRDALAEPRFATLPAVTNLGIRSYLGVPLLTGDGVPLGSFCILDYAPREWRQDDIETMIDLAAAVMTEVELRSANREQAAAGMQAETARARLEGILEGMSDGYIAMDREWHVTALNSSALRIDGRDRGELLGKSHWELWPNTVGTRVEQEYRRVMAEGEVAHFEHHYDDPASDLWHEIDVYRTVDGIACFYRDITTRRQAADALAESERRFRDTFERAAAGIAHIALDGRWLRINPRLASITGCSLDNLHDRTFRDVAHPEDRDVDAAEAASLVRGEIAMYATDKRWLRTSGDTVWVHLTVSLVRTELGEPDYLIAVVEDISERRTLLESARQAQRAAENANRAKSEFVAQMSHELRTPLNAIMGYAQLMQVGVHGPVSEGQTQDLARIQRAARSLTMIISDILSFAKLETGHLALDIQLVDILDVIATAGTLIEPQAASRGISFSLVPSNSEITVRADRERLQQVILNLLTNALKYNRAGGSITITCETLGARLGETHGSMAAVCIADTGTGIAADKMETIFDPFVQLGRGTSSPVDGVGLGLAIGRTLARAMGGDITVASTVGSGSAFTITVPLAPVEITAMSDVS